jgi:cyclopropane fatty-acyl-phospholipid synthase-like methyltransferase
MSGKTLLETGCGRGGGLHYITKKMTPESSVGIDISDSQVDSLLLLFIDTFL